MSAQERNDSDINDVFDSIALSENLIQKEGFEEGFKKGERDGAIEGFHIGFHKGIDIGNEIGYYIGAVEALHVLSKTEELTVRARQVLSKLRELLKEFPVCNDPNVDIICYLEKIRAKYKMICSLLKMEPNVPSSGEFSF
ncbi:hypothetical protein R5R35_013887 [Gryllus longicercus]|uniref:Uncharacterized protein n=1 Tax=Gryllus longicercus TaxID=2509291 RepID=A0AAN9W1K6_9ORTH